jgi:hypothetical protein
MIEFHDKASGKNVRLATLSTGNWASYYESVVTLILRSRIQGLEISSWPFSRQGQQARGLPDRPAVSGRVSP